MIWQLIQTDKHIRTGEWIRVKSRKRFSQAIVRVFGQQYLRAKDANDVTKLLEIPGMLGSLDCMD